MDNKKLERAIEGVYSLKHQKSLSYKIDSIIKLNSNFSSKLTKTNKPETIKNFTDSLSPLESVLAVSQKKEKLKCLFKARLLPSQYLVTPSKILEKLENKVYSSKEPKTIKSETVFPRAKKIIKSRSGKFLFKPGDSLNSHAALQDSCKKLIEDNKKYKKKLSRLTDVVRKRDILKGILMKDEDNTEFKEFRSRLQRAKTIIQNQTSSVET